MINQYFKDFGDIINSIDFIQSSNIHKRKQNDFFGIIEGSFQFENGTLEILEVISITDKALVKKKYKYHFMNKNNEMVFRYDNAPHHPKLATYPNHKHLPNELIESNEPDLFLVLSEIKHLLNL